MAAPHVSGALAVLRSAGLSPEEAVERLLATAVDLGEPGPDRVFGAGRLDLAAAVAGVAVPASPPTEPPTEAELPAGEPDVAAPPRDELPARDVPLPLALLATGLVVLTGAGTVAAARR
jgi:subtilisin family serine protease